MNFCTLCRKYCKNISQEVFKSLPKTLNEIFLNLLPKSFTFLLLPPWSSFLHPTKQFYKWFINSNSKLSNRVLPLSINTIILFSPPFFWHHMIWAPKCISLSHKISGVYLVWYWYVTTTEFCISSFIWCSKWLPGVLSGYVIYFHKISTFFQHLIIYF